MRPLCAGMRKTNNGLMTSRSMCPLHAPAPCARSVPMQAYADYNDLITMTEELISRLVLSIKGSYKVQYHPEGPDKPVRCAGAGLYWGAKSCSGSVLKGRGSLCGCVYLLWCGVYYIEPP